MTTAEIRPVAPSSPDPNFPSMKLEVKAVNDAGVTVYASFAARAAHALERLMSATTDGLVARVFKRVTPSQ